MSIYTLALKLYNFRVTYAFDNDCVDVYDFKSHTWFMWQAYDPRGDVVIVFMFTYIDDLPCKFRLSTLVLTTLFTSYDSKKAILIVRRLSKYDFFLIREIGLCGY